MGLAPLLTPWLWGGAEESMGPGLNPELGLLGGLQRVLGTDSGGRRPL